MKKLIGIILANIAFFSFLILIARNDITGRKRSTYESLQAMGHYNTMLQLIEAAGARDYFSQPIVGGYTLFAPTDDAWAIFAHKHQSRFERMLGSQKDAQAAINRILLETDRRDIKEIHVEQNLTTVTGKTFKVMSDRSIDGAYIIESLETVDAIIHGIDRVLEPGKSYAER